MNQPVALDSYATVSLVDYIPDAFVRDGQVFKKSDDIENLAFGLEVKNLSTAEVTKTLAACRHKARFSVART